jgi:hypothetical protein
VTTAQAVLDQIRDGLPAEAEQALARAEQLSAIKRECLQKDARIFGQRGEDAMGALALIDQVTHPMQAAPRRAYPGSSAPTRRWLPCVAVITFSDTKELTATDSRSCSNFGCSTFAAVANGEHMAEDQLITIEEASKKGASIPFTRDYEYDTWFSHNTIPQGTKALIARTHRGLLGKITHVDVRLANGDRIRSVPIDYLVV